MKRSSPEYLQVSLAAAMTLGLKKGSFYRCAKLYCLNLLLTYPEGCRAACSYCGLARPETSEESLKVSSSFIRVEWPTFPTELIVEKAAECDTLDRACISTLTHPNNMRDTMTILKMFGERTDLPISILSNPTTTSRDEIQALRDAGADRFTVAVDLVTEVLFEKHRGKTVKGPHRWDRYWQALEESAEIFGKGKIGAHLIVGMGETEREMVSAIQRVADLGGTTHLFSFYPEGGSRLEGSEPCDAAHYRKIQLARYMIDKGITSFDRMVFDNVGAIVDYGVDGDRKEEVIGTGKPFETCGCPGKDDKETACNRPFGDGPPSDIRSYPFPLEASDVTHVRAQMNGRTRPPEIRLVEPMEGVDVDAGTLQKARAVRPDGARRLTLYLPSFRRHETSEVGNACASNSFPAVSLTGTACQLVCDHCRGKLLHSMLPATDPAALLEVAARAVDNGAEGLLLSGGSDRENRVPFAPFFDAIARIKATYGITIAAHTGLVDRDTARGLADAGVDTAMIDIIGSDETIRQVYHLDKTADDFEQSLKHLCDTSMKVAPHIVMGLHYGQMKGERVALDIVLRYPTSSLVLVAAMPYYARDPSMFPATPADAVGDFIALCRNRLPERELVLGCARPGGLHRQQTDLYALAAGIDSIAFPADGTVAAAREFGYETEVRYACCSTAIVEAGLT